MKAVAIRDANKQSNPYSYRISGKEYWFKKLAIGEVLRISFFTDTTSFSKEQIDYIEKIMSK